MRHSFGTLLCFFALMTANCDCAPAPNPDIPDDTLECAAAGMKLSALGCEEAVLADGTSFQAYCEDVQPRGHLVNPSCLKTIETCAEIRSKCGQ